MAKINLADQLASQYSRQQLADLLVKTIVDLKKVSRDYVSLSERLMEYATSETAESPHGVGDNTDHHTDEDRDSV